MLLSCVSEFGREVMFESYVMKLRKEVALGKSIIWEAHHTFCQQKTLMKACHMSSHYVIRLGLIMESLRLLSRPLCTLKPLQFSFVRDGPVQ